MQQNEKLQTLGIEDIKTKIYEIRGLKVMLDKDLAELYHISTGNLNKAVKRNLKRFPEDFMFRLSDEENKNLIFQNGISRHGGSRYTPYAFTELGITMLSSVLQSPIAIQTNIFIMRTFVMLKNNIYELQQTNSKIEQLRLEIHSYIEDILHD